MVDFTIRITDIARLAGITAARLDHNKSMPLEAVAITRANPDYKADVITKSAAVVPRTITDTHLTGRRVGQIDTDQQYLQYIVDMATASYATQHNTGGPTPTMKPATAQAMADLPDGAQIAPEDPPASLPSA